MNKYNRLLSRISEEYSIKRGKTEEIQMWKCRIIYSLLGRMAIASLLDSLEEGSVSIIHFKNRIKQILSSYISMYTELSNIFPTNPEEIAQEIYDIFLHTGLIYHRPDRILMSSKSTSVCRGVKFTRGYPIDSEQMLSGLGSYVLQDEDNDSISLSDMFLLEEDKLTDKWENSTNTIIWNTFEPDRTTQYLRTTPPYSKGYWSDMPDKDGGVSLLRTGLPGAQLYYHYTIKDASIKVSQLAHWQVENMNYRMLANACLAYRGTLPPITYRQDGELTYISFKYLPPPAELYLFKLYSWPTRYSDFPCDFNRVCVSKVFDALRDTISMQGYTFRRE